MFLLIPLNGQSMPLKYCNICCVAATMIAKMLGRSADPLEMDDGKELIEMVCTSYESPDDAPEDDQHDFSMPNSTAVDMSNLFFGQATTYATTTCAIDRPKGH